MRGSKIGGHTIFAAPQLKLMSAYWTLGRPAMRNQRSAVPNNHVDSRIAAQRLIKQPALPIKALPILSSILLGRMFAPNLSMRNCNFNNAWSRTREKKNRKNKLMSRHDFAGHCLLLRTHICVLSDCVSFSEFFRLFSTLSLSEFNSYLPSFYHTFMWCAGFSIHLNFFFEISKKTKNKNNNTEPKNRKKKQIIEEIIIILFFFLRKIILTDMIMQKSVRQNNIIFRNTALHRHISRKFDRRMHYLSKIGVNELLYRDMCSKGECKQTSTWKPCISTILSRQK